MKLDKQEPGRWHRHVIRVRYQETDQMGVAYHANYINWFEIGRTELIRERGLSYRSIEEKGLYLPVVELESNFRQPARYDDLLHLYTRITAYTAMTVHFESRICRPSAETDASAQNASVSEDQELDEVVPVGDLLVEGLTRHMWLNRDWKPARIDKEAPELYRLLGDAR
ncbi:thioesterase family protein [Paenibacillus hodogayensis]|uniref:Thioesterase family protein n=1 Tax=Paenibacillus hodogayensis TaxID=279208 RepID=A0ABV5VWG8_9BACL